MILFSTHFENNRFQKNHVKSRQNAVNSEPGELKLKNSWDGYGPDNTRKAYVVGVRSLTLDKISSQPPPPTWHQYEYKLIS